jgi:hypothetical protein
MRAVVPDSPYQDNWRWLSLQIRCALEPDEPRLIDHYLAEGRYLANCTPTSPWMVAETSFRLLLDTACDRALPWHWRSLCLDLAWRPLRDLRAAASSLEHRRRWQGWAAQLAGCCLKPSLSSTELLQGYSDE